MLSSARARIALAASAAAVLALTTGATLATAGPSARQASAIYVSPRGNDHNPGTRRAPVRTLLRAQHLVRSRTRHTRQDHTRQDVVVTVEDGTYRLEQPLTFTAADSGNSHSTVVWQAAPGAHPVISGGQQLTHWNLHDAANNIWGAKVPAGMDSRQFYVDGTRADRSRQDVDNADYQFTADGLRTTDPTLQHLVHPRGVQVVMVHNWKDQRCPVVSVSGADVTMAQPCWDSAKLQGKQFDVVSWLENAYEFLDQPGEFYLDTNADYLYYIPRAGQDVQHADAELPVLQTLVEVTGALRHSVHDITFRGLTFSYGTWLGPDTDDGFALGQAGVRLVGSGSVPELPINYYVERQLRGQLMPANVSVSYAHDVNFSRDTFTHLGGAGLALGLGAQHDSVTRSTFRDVSGNGIEFGDITADADHPADPMMITSDNTIRDSVITRTGAEYLSTVGVFAGYTHHTVIDHNTITDLPYTAISVGWGWGITDPEASGGDPRHDGVYKYLPRYVTPTTSSENKITNNRIDDVLNTIRAGGGVYTLGAQRGTVVSGNYVSNVLGGDPSSIPTLGNALANALYSDEGSRYEVWSGNVVENTEYWVSMWDTYSIQENLYTGNFTNTGDAFIAAAPENTLIDNIVVTDSQWPPAAQQIMRTAGVRH